MVGNVHAATYYDVSDGNTAGFCATLRDPASSMRRPAARILGTYKGDKRAYSCLIKTINDRDHELREDVIRALGDFGDRRAIPYILKRLNDTYAFVRKAAIYVLGQFKSRRAVGAIIKKLGSRHHGIPERAADALGNIGDPKAIPALWKKFHDASQMEKVAICVALGKIGTPAAIELLLKIIEDNRKNAYIIRMGAARGLGYVTSSDRRIFLALSRATRDPDTLVRQAAVLALAKRGNPHARPLIEERLHDHDFHVRLCAVKAFGSIPSDTNADVLSGFLNHRNDLMRSVAARSLAMTGTFGAVSALFHVARSDPVSMVRAMANASIVAMIISAGLHFMLDPLLMILAKKRLPRIIVDPCYLDSSLHGLFACD